MPKNTGIVLVCPLDWGLGHASRMIPVIRHFLELGHRVILGGSGKSGDLLRLSFPQLAFVPLPGPEIRYSVNTRWMVFNLLRQVPRMLQSSIREHFALKRIVQSYQVNTVVSDNRYGLFCNKAHCIFVTHQLSPVLPAWLGWAEYPLYRMIRRIILQYDECWIPDFSDPMVNLSGKLSHRYALPRNARFTGLLSRFDLNRTGKVRFTPEKYDCVFVVSGPEPQCTVFRTICIDLALQIKRKTMIIAGFQQHNINREIPQDAQLTIVPHLNPDHFRQILLHAGAIICRSGYSGIMDLVALQRTALLVPTPGQSEQEYLARYLSEQGFFTEAKQHELDEKIITGWLERQGLPFDFSALLGNEDFRKFLP